MKNELIEIQQKIDELNNNQQKISKKAQNRYDNGYRNTQEEAQKIVDELNLIGSQLGPLTTRRDELLNKIRIREEALDLLQELGIIDDNLKQSSIMNTIKSLF